MDLWIRSQDKELLMKISTLRYNQAKDEYAVLAYDVGCACRILGIYKTKERALEVLDEIQQLLNTNRIEQYVTTNSGGICAKKTLIYEMPKE